MSEGEQDIGEAWEDVLRVARDAMRQTWADKPEVLAKLEAYWASLGYEDAEAP